MRRHSVFECEAKEPDMTTIVKYTKKWKITITKDAKGKVVAVDMEPI
jgi:hypothetical protein